MMRSARSVVRRRVRITGLSVRVWLMRGWNVVESCGEAEKMRAVVLAVITLSMSVLLL